jgi:N-acetylmuramoyl-L-alanine amidase
MLLVVFFFALPLSVHASSDGTYKVGVPTLRVHSKPYMQSVVIGYLSRNASVTVDEKRFGWAKINYKGQIGWIASQYLYESNSSSSSAPGSGKFSKHTTTVNVSHANVRTGPGTGYSVIEVMDQGDVLEVLDQKNQWIHVRLSSGNTGWIASSLTSLSASNINGHSLTGFNFVIDAGHGGFDPGAVAFDGGVEKKLTLQVAQKVADQLRDAGATVILTRSSDRFLTLAQRVHISRLYHTHAFISIHFNSFNRRNASGISTYYYDSVDRKLAQDIQHQLADRTRLQNNGVRFGNYYVLRENPDPSILVEGGFITNPYDLSMIQTSQYQSHVAEAITQGVINYFGN